MITLPDLPTPPEALEVFKGYVKNWSPSHAPRKWIIINGTCCICTAAYFIMGVLPKQWVGYEFAKLTYIPYNFLICGIWFIEVVLYMLFDDNPWAWHKLGELALATFFVGDAIMYLYEWLIEGEPLHRWEILVYTAIDFTVYFFYLIMAIREERHATLQRNQARLKEQEMVDTAATPAWLQSSGGEAADGEATTTPPVAVALSKDGDANADVDCINCPIFPVIFGDDTSQPEPGSEQQQQQPQTDFKLMT